MVNETMKKTVILGIYCFSVEVLDIVRTAGSVQGLLSVIHVKSTYQQLEFCAR